MKFKTINSKLILSPKKLLNWQIGGIITPTPFVMKNCVRVYTGFCDKKGISRIGYIDLDKKNPYKIKKISKKPILNIGSPGNFDDNGVILGDVIYVKKTYHMFYVGFQIPKKTKFLAFTGLAKSYDGINFKKVQESPVLDRNKNGTKFRAIHSVIKINKQFHFFLGEGSAFKFLNKKYYPMYDAKVFKYNKIDNFPSNIQSRKIINRKKKEYRLGRPSVFNYKKKLHLFFTYDTLNKKYSYGYAYNKSGNFIRNDKNFIISKSEKNNADAKMICYPRYFKTKKNYLLYSGNGMGKTGLFLSEIIETN